ncbi:MAG: UDP-glucose 4-epimerase GalE [Mycoplasmataceae bacterium]|nr:UDP-glucose 4-epimerase GalE [Mycoplasmataceae bacterium]
MKILITGGAGYIGSVIVEHFVKKHTIVILDDLSTNKKRIVNKNATLINGSILNERLLNKIFARYQFNLVIHLAAKTVVSESMKKPNKYYQHNVIGTKNILKYMKKYGCEKIIFSSSAAVYGNSKQNFIQEKTPKKPCNPYGKTKLLAEKLIEQAGINYVILRFFNVSGASNSLKFGMMKKTPTLLIPAINRLISENKKPIIYGNQYDTKDGTCVRDYVHIEDIVSACILSVSLLKKNDSGIYNLGSGKGYSVLEITKLACKINNVKFEYSLKNNRPGDPSTLIASIEKARKELHWKPKYSISQMIKSDYLFLKQIKCDH